MAVLQQAVELLHVLHHRVQVPLVLALAVDVGLLSEDDVPVAVVGDLVALAEDPLDQPGTVLGAAHVVLAELGVVVEGGAPPGGGAGGAAGVGVIFRGVSHHVEDALGPEVPQSVQQHVGEGLAPELVRGGRQVHGAVVEGHGADFLTGLHPLNPAHVGDVGLLGGEEGGLGQALYFFSQLDPSGFHTSRSSLVK